MSDKKIKPKKPYRTPEIKVVTYNPRDKVMAGVYCDNGSGSEDVGVGCDSFDCELP